MMITCIRVDSLIPSIGEVLHDMVERDPLEKYLIESLSMTDLEFEHPSTVQEMFETILAIEESEDIIVIEEENMIPDGLVLKELNKNLRYALLGENGTKPMIISLVLNANMEAKLLEVLKKNIDDFAWSIEDIKGISPSIYMHKILMEKDYTPTVEHQRRLNPTMKKVMKKEVLKWLHVGFIYAISDDTWFSPVQVVPKRGGMIVVKKDKDELISSSTITAWQVCIDYRKLNKAKRKNHFPLPFIDQMLERLVGHAFYCFLDGYLGYNQIIIAPED